MLSLSVYREHASPLSMHRGVEYMVILLNWALNYDMEMTVQTFQILPKKHSK